MWLPGRSCARRLAGREAAAGELEHARRGRLLDVLGHRLAGGDPGDRHAGAGRRERELGGAVDLVELGEQQAGRAERAVAADQLVDLRGGRAGGDDEVDLEGAGGGRGGGARGWG